MDGISCKHGVSNLVYCEECTIEKGRTVSEKEKDLRLGLFGKLSGMIDGINYMQVREIELLGENERVQLMTIKLDLQKMILSLEEKGKE